MARIAYFTDRDIDPGRGRCAILERLALLKSALGKSMLEVDDFAEICVVESEVSDVLERAGLSSPDVVGGFLESFRPYLLAIANAELPQDLQAKIGPSDLVQKTLFQGFRERGAVRGATRRELARWLRRILLRYIQGQTKFFSTEKRDLAREQMIEFHHPTRRECSPSALVESKEESERLALALARLPAHYRLAIALRQFEDQSFAEIGARLGRSEEAARKLWARAIKQLQMELGIDVNR